MSWRLQNDLVGIEFDAAGNLVSLRNLVLDRECLARPGPGFWTLFYPSEEDPETPIRLVDQAPAEIDTHGDKLVVTYPRLVDARGRELAASLSFTVELAGEEVILRARIENRGPAELRELWFPDVGGLRGLGGDPKQAYLLYPESAGRRIVDPLSRLFDRAAQPVRGDRRQALRDLYPGRASMQWMGFYGGDAGLYVGSHDSSLQSTATNVMLHPATDPCGDVLSLGFIKYPFCKPGAAWESEPFVLALHGEDWRADARRYRRFADTYQDHTRERPAWVRTMPGLHDIVMLHQHGRINHRYDGISGIADAAQAGGVNTIKLTGWAKGGHDRRYPDFVPSDRLGGERSLVAHIRRARERGFRVVLYLHFVQMTTDSDFFARHGMSCAMKGPTGQPFIDIFTWPSNGSLIAMNERFQLINACVGTAAWQEQVLDGVRRALAYGADCAFLDQTAGQPGSYLCFDESHGHPSPAMACGPGKTALSRRARDIVTAAGDEKALGAEYIADVILQYYDFTIPFGMGFLPGGEHFGELYRYTFPEDILCTQYIARENVEQLHYSFVMGYRFFLTPGQQCDLLTDLDPAFVSRLRVLVELRARHSSLLLEGRFCETEPLRIDNPALVARAYESGDGGAVAVWNPTEAPQPLGVEWPGRELARIDTPAGDVGACADTALSASDVAVMVFSRP